MREESFFEFRIDNDSLTDLAYLHQNTDPNKSIKVNISKTAFLIVVGPPVLGFRKRSNTIKYATCYKDFLPFLLSQSLSLNNLNIKMEANNCLSNLVGNESGNAGWYWWENGRHGVSVSECEIDIRLGRTLQLVTSVSFHNCPWLAKNCSINYVWKTGSRSSYNKLKSNFSFPCLNIHINVNYFSSLHGEKSKRRWRVNIPKFNRNRI